MTANASASVLQILVGSDQQDWSDARMSFEAGVNQRDRSGLFKITGRLTLACINTAPESLNPRINQARWCRGQIILVNEINSTGSYVRHRYGWLYILKEPCPPSPKNPKLELEVGCILSLRDYREPSEDQSGIDLGTATTRTTAIGSLLAAAGINTWIGEVPLYPIAYPLPKERGSYVAQAGEIAYAGLKALQQLNDGTITAVDLRLPGINATPLMVATVGRDEVQYTPQIGAETPVEELIATGVSVNAIDTWGEFENCDFEYAPGSAKIVRRSCFYQKADATTELYRTRTWEAKGLVLPQDYPGVETLVLSDTTTNTKTYEAAIDQQVVDYSGQKSLANGKLLQEQSQRVRPFAAAILSLWNSFTAAQKANYAAFFPAQDDLTTTNYLYECKDTLKGKQTRSLGLLGAVLTDLDITVSSPTGIVPTSSASETYQEDRPNIWTYLRSSGAPLVQVYPDAIQADDTIAQKIQLVTTSEPPSVSPTQNQPPSTERRPDRYTRVEFFIEGRAKFGTFAGAQEQSRTRTMEVRYCSDVAKVINNAARSCTQTNQSEQLGQIAQTEGTLLIGRRQGQRVKLPVNDLWLSDTNPCAVVVCREPVLLNDQIVYDEVTFMIDGLHFIHNRTSAIVAFDAIWLAIKPHDAPASRLPFSQVFLDTFGEAEGFEDVMLPYVLTPAPIFDYFGAGEGFVDAVNTRSFDSFGEGEGFEDRTAITNYDSFGVGEGLSDTQLLVYDSFGEGEGFEDVAVIADPLETVEVQIEDWLTLSLSGLEIEIDGIVFYVG